MVDLGTKKTEENDTQRVAGNKTGKQKLFGQGL